MLRRGVRWLRRKRRTSRPWYADEVVRIGHDGLTVRGYYWPVGRKRIPFDAIRNVHTHALTMGRGQYRVHGIDRHGRWYSRDRTRSDKSLAIVLDLGGRIRPVLTPADPQTVLALLDQHVGNRATSS